MAKRFSTAKGPSQRQLRAGELIRHTLMEILQREEFDHPDLAGLSVTVTEVRPSPDLRNATVFATTLGGERLEAGLAALNEVAPQVQGLLGQKIDLKFTPRLTFKKDESFEEAARIERLLSRPEVVRDLDNDPERED